MNKALAKILLTIIFSYSFILVLINGSYYFEQLRFIEIEREDLIARLSFLSKSFAFMLYPTMLIFCTIIILLFRSNYLKALNNKLILLSGPVLVGLLFYIELLPYRVWGTLESLIISLAVFIITGYLLSRAYLINDGKH